MWEKKKFKKRLISLLFISSMVMLLLKSPYIASGESNNSIDQMREQKANDADENQQRNTKLDEKGIINAATGSAIQLASEKSENEFEIDSNGVLIKYTGVGGDVEVPYGVTEIGERAFFGCSGVTNIMIPKSVERIRDYAFSECSNLTSIYIPTSIEWALGDCVFSGCINLTSIVIPDNIGHMGKVYDQISNIAHKFFIYKDDYIYKEDALKMYEGLGGDVIIPNGITKIISSVKLYSESPINLTIPDSVTRIDASTFRGSDKLVSITIPNSVTEIGNGAFAGCSNLTSITIPDSVTKIGDVAFSNCRSLTSTTIPNGVTKIQTRTFEDCSNLISITLPNSVTEIEYGAFSRCSSLESITIPENVTNIGVGAFEGCSNLSNATISGTIEYAAFRNCENLKNVKISGAKSIGASAFYNCENLTNVVIEDSVKIDYGAFWGCHNLSSVELPSNLEIIEGAAFWNCNNLESIKIPKGVKLIGGSIFDKRVTIFGTTGSCAESYAKEFGNPFIAIATCIVVYDYESGEPIPDSEVVINEAKYFADDKGRVEVEPGTVNSLIINESGYESYSTTEFAIETLELYPIGLTPTEVFDSEGYIKNVKLQGVGKQIAFSSDIMTEEVSCSYNTTEKCDITVEAYLGDKKVSKYLIINNGTVILENKTGKFSNVNMSMFKPGSQTFSYIEFTDGTRCKKVELLIRNYEVIRY